MVTYSSFVLPFWIKKVNNHKGNTAIQTFHHYVENKNTSLNGIEPWSKYG